jgi:hypothetical protein
MMTKSTSTPSKQKKSRSRKSICRLHVSRADMRNNIKNGTDNPVIAVHRRGHSMRGNSVIIHDKQGNEVARIVQRMHNPLKCGARVWIETYEAVTLIYNDGETTVSELLKS